MDPTSPIVSAVLSGWIPRALIDTAATSACFITPNLHNFWDFSMHDDKIAVSHAVAAILLSFGSE